MVTPEIPKGTASGTGTGSAVVAEAVLGVEPKGRHQGQECAARPTRNAIDDAYQPVTAPDEATSIVEDAMAPELNQDPKGRIRQDDRG